MEMDYTRKFSLQNDKDPEIKQILSSVYQSLQEKGYNPINQDRKSTRLNSSHRVKSRMPASA